MNLYIIILLCVLIILFMYYNKREQFSDTHYGNSNNNSDSLDPSTQLTKKKATNFGLFNNNKAALNL